MFVLKFLKLILILSLFLKKLSDLNETSFWVFFFDNDDDDDDVKDDPKLITTSRMNEFGLSPFYYKTISLRTADNLFSFHSRFLLHVIKNEFFNIKQVDSLKFYNFLLLIETLTWNGYFEPNSKHYYTYIQQYLLYALNKWHRMTSKWRLVEFLLHSFQFVVNYRRYSGVFFYRLFIYTYRGNLYLKAIYIILHQH